MQGRRREDVRLGDLPDDPRPGDYWRYVDGDGEPMRSSEPENLTGGVWGVYPPRGGIGTLTKHTVREHEDGTATIAHGDGSSNSVLITGGEERETWHGFLDRGVWNEV